MGVVFVVWGCWVGIWIIRGWWSAVGVVVLRCWGHALRWGAVCVVECDVNWRAVWRVICLSEVFSTVF